MSDVETFYLEFDPLTGQPIDPAPPVVLVSSPPARARKIIAEVAAAYELTPEDLTGRRRFKYLMEPRWLAMRRIRKELGYSYPQIGQLFNRDHSSVIWACRGGRPNQPIRNKPQEMAA